MTTPLTLQFFGQVQLIQNQQPITAIKSNKELGLFIYLAYTEKSYPREILAEFFWPNRSLKQAQSNLRTVLSRLKQSLGDYLIITRQQVVFRGESPYTLDVRQVEAGLAQVGAKLAHPEQLSATEATDLARTLAHYRGHFLADFLLPSLPEFEVWVERERARWQQQISDTWRALVAHYLSQAQYQMGLSSVDRFLHLIPYDEIAHQQKMRLLALSGQREAALTQFARCETALAQSFDLTPSAETQTLYARIQSGELAPPDNVSSVPPSKSVAPPHNLPHARTSFVGRQKIIDKATDLLTKESTCRLITVIGPGGVGKTRLALEVAQATKLHFADGVYWVSLVGVHDPHNIASTILAALPDGGEPQTTPTEQVLSSLADKEILLVLDNFEQLLNPSENQPDFAEAADTATQLILVIMDNAPQVRLLLTSRESLNLLEEHLLPLTGLSLPTPDVDHTEATLQASAAVRLFMARAQQVRPDITLENAGTDQVVQICRLLEGMPLGIELAATWVRYQTCQDIGQRLEAEMLHLSTSIRNRSARHRSLNAVFTQSWSLLQQTEQTLFSALSIFRNGFTLAAAESIVQATVTDLAVLINKSLLRHQFTGRYDVHEGLRQFGAEKLAESSTQANHLQDTHAHYYAHYLINHKSGLVGSESAKIIAEVMADIDNLRAAWHWLIMQRSWPVIAELVPSLWVFYEVCSRYYEFEVMVSTAQEILFATPAIHAISATGEAVTFDKAVWLVQVRLLLYHGLTLVRLSKPKAALEKLNHCQAILDQGRQHNPTWRNDEDAGQLYFALGDYYWGQGDFEACQVVLEKSMTAFEAAENLVGLGETLILLSRLSTSMGAYAEAIEQAKRAIDLLEMAGEVSRTDYAWDLIGIAYSYIGDYAKAEYHYQVAYDLRLKADDQLGLAVSHYRLGKIALQQGDYALAETYFLKVIPVQRQSGRQVGVLNALIGVGNAARNLGNLDKAKAAYEEAATIARSINIPEGVAESVNGLAQVAYARGQMRQAQHHYEQSLAAWQGQLSDPVLRSPTLSGLGLTTGMQQNFKESFTYFQEAFQCAIAYDLKPVILETLISLTQVFHRALPPGQAVALLTFVRDHPSAIQETADRADDQNAELIALLSPEAQATAQQLGSALTLEQMITWLEIYVLPAALPEPSQLPALTAIADAGIDMAISSGHKGRF
ncbi:MAG: tetratricopeptide repeat protein [Chloroflexota bacterium]